MNFNFNSLFNFYFPFNFSFPFLPLLFLFLPLHQAKSLLLALLIHHIQSQLRTFSSRFAYRIHYQKKSLHCKDSNRRYSLILLNHRLKLKYPSKRYSRSAKWSPRLYIPPVYRFFLPFVSNFLFLLIFIIFLVFFNTRYHCSPSDLISNPLIRKPNFPPPPLLLFFAALANP